MALLPLPRELHPDFREKNVAPTGAVEIDYNNKFADILFFVSLGINPDFNIVNGEIASDNTGVRPAVDENGPYGQPLTENDSIIFSDREFYDVNNSDGVTYVALVKFVSGGNFCALASKMLGSGASRANYLFGTQAEAGMPFFSHKQTSGGFRDAQTTTLTIPSVGSNFVSMAAGSGNVDFRVNDDTENVSYVGTMETNTFPLSIHEGTGTTGDRSSISHQYVILLFRRKLTASEVLELRADIYQVLKPVEQFYYESEPAVVGGGVTVDVPTGALALTGQVPTIDATDDKTVEIPLGALALTGLTPTVQAGAAVDVEIPTGALNLTGLTPVVVAPNTVEVPLGALALTGFAPVIQVGDNVTVDIPTGALSLSGFIPVVVAPNAVSVPLGALLLTGFAPSIIAGVGVEVPLGALNLLGFAPNIDLTDNQTVSIPLGALTLTGFAPVVDFGSQAVEIPLGSLNLTGFIPAILAQGIIWTVQADTVTNWAEQADTSTTWTEQTDDSTTWTIQ